LVGPARAKMVLMAGQKIGAEEALAWGLVDRVIPAAGLIAGAAELAADALAARPEHVAAIKALVSEGPAAR
jgi:enoyl-CoA hydratase/carnithine racemase